jgi:hypothetical protein
VVLLPEWEADRFSLAKILSYFFRAKVKEKSIVASVSKFLLYLFDFWRIV